MRFIDGRLANQRGAYVHLRRERLIRLYLRLPAVMPSVTCRLKTT